MSFQKREDDNGLNRQLGKPRIVYDPFGGKWCIERVTVKCLKWVVGVIKESLLKQL